MHTVNHIHYLFSIPALPAATTKQITSKFNLKYRQRIESVHTWVIHTW